MRIEKVVINASPFILLCKSGLITEVAPALKKLQDVGLWISDEVVKIILKQANEL